MQLLERLLKVSKETKAYLLRTGAISKGHLHQPLRELSFT
jgi:hypothetical protein